MQLREVSEQDKEEYNQFVAANSSGSFLQSWEWGEWQSVLGRQVKRYKLKVESGDTIGVVQLIRMPLWGKKYYLYAPYGPVLAGGENFQFSIFNELKSKFLNAVFMRIEPKSLDAIPLALSAKTTNVQPGKTLLINLAKSEEELLADMHHKTRYNIKLAQKHGVEIKDEFAISIGHGLFFDEALKLILQTSKRQKFGTFPESYYRKLCDFFAVHNQGDLRLHIYKAIFQNQLLATAIMLDFGNTRTFLFGGSSEFHKNVMAPYLLHWQAMLGAKAQGLNFYDFWGIETSSGATPGFVRFKLGFGGEEKEYAGAYDMVNNQTIYKLYKFSRVVNKIIRLR